MNQCIQMAEQLSLPSCSTKRKSLGTQDERAPKRQSLPDQRGHGSAIPFNSVHCQTSGPARPTNVAILPRPDTGVQRASSQPPAAVPKKRGRPSRADKARRNLRPNLPPHLAPKPPQQRPAPVSAGPAMPGSGQADHAPVTSRAERVGFPTAADAQQDRMETRGSPPDEACPVSRSRVRLVLSCSVFNERTQRPLPGGMPVVLVPDETALRTAEAHSSLPDPVSLTSKQASLDGRPVTAPPSSQTQISAAMSSQPDDSASMAGPC